MISSGPIITEKLGRVCPIEPNGPSLINALLAPHRSYVADIDALMAAAVDLKGMAHITGGGIMDNLPRVLPEHLATDIRLTEAQIPTIFRHMWAWSEMEIAEAFRVFNMGVGMVLVVGKESAEKVWALIPEAFLLGELVPANVQENRVTVALQG